LRKVKRKEKKGRGLIEEKKERIPFVLASSILRGSFRRRGQEQNSVASMQSPIFTLHASVRIIALSAPIFLRSPTYPLLFCFLQSCYESCVETIKIENWVSLYITKYKTVFRLMCIGNEKIEKFDYCKYWFQYWSINWYWTKTIAMYIGI